MKRRKNLAQTSTLKKKEKENRMFLKYSLNNAFYNNVGFTVKVGLYVEA